MKYFLKGIITIVLLIPIATIALIALILDTIRIFGGSIDYFFLGKIELIVNEWMEL
jgi:uncharacterized membrane protein